MAILHKQIESINRVIDSTNSIIESMSIILNPAGADNSSISYDLRIKTLLSEFSLILKEKNRQLEERDNTIEELQYKLCKIEVDTKICQMSLHITNTSSKSRFRQKKL